MCFNHILFHLSRNTSKKKQQQINLRANYLISDVFLKGFLPRKGFKYSCPKERGSYISEKGSHGTLILSVPTHTGHSGDISEESF